jgi:hypothetical protein
MEYMDIASAKYQQRKGKNVSILAVISDRVWTVPLDPANRHYAEIMRQVEAGELVIQEAESN